MKPVEEQKIHLNIFKVLLYKFIYLATSVMCVTALLRDLLLICLIIKLINIVRTKIKRSGRSIIVDPLLRQFL